MTPSASHCRLVMMVSSPRRGRSGSGLRVLEAMEVTSLLGCELGITGSFAYPLPLRQAAAVLLVYFGRSGVANSSIPR